MTQIINSVDYTKWPVPSFARAFYKLVSVGEYGYLVPAQKLGSRQIALAEAARMKAAREILEYAEVGVHSGKIITDDDVNNYVREHLSFSDPLTASWYAALWIPLEGSPSVKEIYDYIPRSLLSETQDFFTESIPASLESPEKTGN